MPDSLTRAQFALQALVAAGYVTQAKVDEALALSPAPAGEPEAIDKLMALVDLHGSHRWLTGAAEGAEKYKAAGQADHKACVARDAVEAAIRKYGQAMAEHARAVAMEDHQPSITWVDDMGCTHTMSAEKAASELKALFDAWPDGLNEIEAAIEGWRRAAPPQGEQT